MCRSILARTHNILVHPRISIPFQCRSSDLANIKQTQKFYGMPKSSNVLKPLVECPENTQPNLVLGYVLWKNMKVLLFHLWTVVVPPPFMVCSTMNLVVKLYPWLRWLVITTAHKNSLSCVLRWLVIGNTRIKFFRKQKVLLVYETIIMIFSNWK